ncbi:hypothetical protein QU600_001630 [Orientia tsutsugamushi]|uniref:hypothetical protein n=1 Tax=Orientia tsutsugamushi TaxID=784 RepID=UPI00315E0078
MNYLNQFRKRSNKGIALNKLRRHQEAVESCNLAIKYDSDNVYAYQLANELAKKIKKSNLSIIMDVCSIVLKYLSFAGHDIF